MPVFSELLTLEACTGAAMRLERGRPLRIVDPGGQQVADLALFSATDLADGFSPGRTIDYNQSVRTSIGAVLFSYSSVPLAKIVEDTVGVHDLLLAPCSRLMFERRGEREHPSCHDNLIRALSVYGISTRAVVSTLNVFMDVRLDADGRVAIAPPASRAGDAFAIEALVDLIVGVTACSSELTNNGRCKPVLYGLQ